MDYRMYEPNSETPIDETLEAMCTLKLLVELFNVISNLYFERSYQFLIVSPYHMKRHIGIKSNKRAEQKSETMQYVADKYGFQPTEGEADAIGVAEYSAWRVVQ